MGSGLSKDQRKLLEQTGFRKRELVKMKKSFEKLAGEEGHGINKEQFKELFRDKLKSETRALVRSDAGKQVDLGEIFDSVDADGNNLVTLEELVLWLGIFKKGTDDKKLAHMFDSFDLDRSGVLEAGELQNVLNVLQVSRSQSKGDSVTDSDCSTYAKQLLEKLDPSNTGKITRAQWIKKGKEIRLVDELLGAQFIAVMDGFKTK
eukprot:TRINITY_DN12061_c0_g1_i1.p1 TRINITY_DN12061_c0_g1~~TRINITY_DN12061_c0_g1_i1.p1  ORF type:complete len:205 (-),score=35.75 TRINITY_DN12061_c0_g1_i1:4-618(-)